VYRLVAIQQSAIGRVNAAVVASNAIGKFRPRYILLIGLAGGIGKKTQLGDIVVADQIVDYEQQKLLSESAERSWQVYRPDASLLSGVNRFAHTKWTRLIKAKRPVRGTVKVHIGAIASGDKILASGDDTLNLVTSLLERWPHLNGIEMEGGGVAVAINNVSSPAGFLMIRAVGDIVGDPKKSDQWRNYAVGAVAAFTVGYLTSGPVPPSQEVSLGRPKPTDLSETQTSSLANTSDPEVLSASEESIAQDAYLDHLAPTRLRLAAYDPDSTFGPDLLGIRADVNAFASVIAAHTTSPPLSIGVFGEWGYGKSFFMRQVRDRVAEIASDARASGRLQKDIAYYKRIVQIEFNAWHYVEGNLWASLVEHILFNLQISDSPQDEAQALQTKLLSELGIQTLAKTEIAGKVEELKADLAAIEQSIAEKNKELEETAEEIQTLKVTNILGAVMALPETKAEIEKLNVLRSDLDLPAVNEGIDDMRHAIAEAEAVVGRSTALLLPLVSAPDRRRKLIWLSILLLCAPLVGIIVGWLLSARGTQWLTQVGAILATLTTWLYVLIGGLRRATSWVAARVKKIEQVKQHLEARIESETAKVRDRIIELKTQREDLLAKYVEQQTQLSAAQKNVEQLEDELKHATPLHLLAKLIQDRVESNDYRKHLGLLALVRRDFERISKFIEAENQRLGVFHTIEEEEDGSNNRINRIVLYIDDLDRCPAEKVVQVLQAVHLLLAFPLFVVVVAVDARWVSGALSDQYGLLLGARKDFDQSRVLPSDYFDSATPLDYLEKIFQIPFWLSPLNRAARRSLIDGLIGSGESKANWLKDQTGLDHKADAVIKSTPDLVLTTDSPLTEGVTIEAEDALATDLNPQGLVIRPGELAFINEMNPLLGRSPRALKRFVNIFRLIKSGVPDASEAPQRSRNIDLDSDLRIAMFFLAVVTNSPDVSKQFFESLHPALQNRKRGSVLPKEEWERLLIPDNAGNNPHWHQIKIFLGSAAAEPIREATIERLASWASRVSRFSFYGESSSLQWTNS
jgi:nucleoside phosphorylase